MKISDYIEEIAIAVIGLLALMALTVLIVFGSAISRGFYAILIGIGVIAILTYIPIGLGRIVDYIANKRGKEPKASNKAIQQAIDRQYSEIAKEEGKKVDGVSSALTKGY